MADKLKVVEQEPIDDPSLEKKETESTKKEEEPKVDEAPPKVPEKDLQLEDEDESGPPPPARPTSPRTKALNELKEAFPDIDEKIRTAVLIASSGELDPAFNALLYISDPSFQPEIPSVSAAPASGKISTQTNSTLTEDEVLARKLQKEFEKEEHIRKIRSRRRRGERTRQQPNPEDSPDEFEQIKESFTQGFEEARTTLNGWVSGITKKFSDLSDEDQREHQKQQLHQSQQSQQGQQHSQSQKNPKLFGALGGSSYSKKSSRFDEDPVILSNDFHNRISLEDNDNEEEVAPLLPRRKTSHEQSDSFTESTPTTKKWQPLNSDAPVNSDAFLVTDSEEEAEPETKKADK